MDIGSKASNRYAQLLSALCIFWLDNLKAMSKQGLSNSNEE